MTAGSMRKTNLSIQDMAKTTAVLLVCCCLVLSGRANAAREGLAVADAGVFGEVFRVDGVPSDGSALFHDGKTLYCGAGCELRVYIEVSL